MWSTRVTTAMAIGEIAASHFKGSERLLRMNISQLGRCAYTPGLRVRRDAQCRSKARKPPMHLEQGCLRLAVPTKPQTASVTNQAADTTGAAPYAAPARRRNAQGGE